MERIPSFSVDHTKLTKGMYISRIDAPEIITYDIRMKVPNQGDYMDTGSMHTMEHIFATFARNSQWKDSVIYVGPMGCRTGFYLITRNLPHKEAIALVNSALEYISTFSGEIPGASAAECGNWQDQNLDEAKNIAKDMIPILENWTESKLAY